MYNFECDRKLNEHDRQYWKFDNKTQRKGKSMPEHHNLSLQVFLTSLDE